MIKMAKSDDHIWRCVDIIKNDKSISDNTIVLMFLEYKRLILEENERRTPSNLGKAKGRTH
jgi:hypothetical protein